MQARSNLYKIKCVHVLQVKMVRDSMYVVRVLVVLDR